MRKELQLKKEHHYVWANYLRNWSVDNKSLWFNTSKGKVILETTRLVAKERFFYKLTPISNDHLFLLEQTFGNSENLNDHLGFIKKIMNIQAFEMFLKQENIMNEEWAQRFEAHKHNTLENIHTNFENGVADILPALAKKDLSCLGDNKKIISLYSYLGQQFARTKCFKDRSLLAMSKNNTEQAKWVLQKTEECWWLWSHLVGVNIGASLFFERHLSTISLLVNNTKQTFITSDHPVINIHPELTGELDKSPEHHQFDLYYPLSPTVALAVTRSNRFPKGISEVPIQIVEEVNTELARNSHAHIFGNTRQAIQPYLKFIGERHSKVKQYVKTFQ